LTVMNLFAHSLASNADAMKDIESTKAYQEN